MPSDKVKWELKPHSIGKHKILQEYMKAWLPIISKNEKEVAFIDAFAGPGHYSGGEKGSPLISLESLLTHEFMRTRDCVFNYLFIEAEKNRCRELKATLTKIESKIPPHSCEVLNTTFKQGIDELFEISQRYLALRLL